MIFACCFCVALMRVSSVSLMFLSLRLVITSEATRPLIEARVNRLPSSNKLDGARHMTIVSPTSTSMHTDTSDLYRPLRPNQLQSDQDLNKSQGEGGEREEDGVVLSRQLRRRCSASDRMRAARNRPEGEMDLSAGRRQQLHLCDSGKGGSDWLLGPK